MPLIFREGGFCGLSAKSEDLPLRVAKILSVGEKYAEQSKTDFILSFVVHRARLPRRNLAFFAVTVKEVCKKHNKF